jgi:sialic acid synthase SpsE
VEKHITLDRSMEGGAISPPWSPRHRSQWSETLTALASTGYGLISCNASECKCVSRKSVVAARPIAKGQIIRESDLSCKRPGTGLSPALLNTIVGKNACRDVAVDTILDWSDLVDA